MNTPNIRFKGFADDWEQCTFGEFAEYKKGPFGSALKKDLFVPRDGTTVKVYEQQNAINKDWTLARYYITNKYSQKLSGFKVKGGDIIVSCAGTIGEIYELPKEAEPGIINQALMRVRVNESIVNKNMFKILFTNMVDDFTRVHSNGSAIKNIPPFSDLKPMRELIPCMDEQCEISSLFGNLDKLITLHQRKCNDLQEVKKYMLQKMFPKKGAKVPEIRFAGFTGDWEQRKLGEVFKEYSEKKHDELPPLTIIQGGGTILREESDRNLQYDKSSLSNYKMVKKDDFIVHLRSFEGGLEKANSDGIISPAYHTLHGENTDARFYYPFFRSQIFIEVLLKPHVYGIRDGKSIDIDGMKTIDIPVPSLEEQQKIGSYIEQMDNLIFLHQQKCESLNAMKKYMLQNMFPQSK